MDFLSLRLATGCGHGWPRPWSITNASSVVCYRGANWLEVGLTTGRGRQDRDRRSHGAATNYPLRADAREALASAP